MALLYTVIRVLLGVFFLLAGAVKVTDHISAEVNQQMKQQFVQFAEVFPLKDLGYKPESTQYMLVVGWIEAMAGLLLAFGPQLLQEISNFVLSVIMIGAIYTLLMLREPLAMCAPATVCLGLLLLLNVRGRVRRAKFKFE